MRPLILFDFDGTLADSVDAIVDVVNVVLEGNGYRESISRERLRTIPTKKLLKEVGVPFWKIPRFIKECRAALEERLPRIRLHPHIKEILQELDADLGVITSNDAAVVETVLKREQLRTLFVTVKGGSLFRKYKDITRTRKHLGLPKSKVLYVGDEVRDIHAARVAGVWGMVVAWGMHAEQTLKEARPDILVRTPKEARQAIEAWIQSVS